MSPQSIDIDATNDGMRKRKEERVLGGLDANRIALGGSRALVGDGSQPSIRIGEGKAGSLESDRVCYLIVYVKG